MRADDVRERGRRSPELLQREAIPEVPGADAAVLLRERKPEEAERSHLRQDLRRDPVGLFDLLFERLEALLDEVASGAREERKLLRDVEVHGPSPGAERYGYVSATCTVATPSVSRS